MSKIRRHSLVVMLTHWSVAISGIVLLFSGFGQLPMYKRYFITSIPGLEWVGNFEMTYVLHLVAAVVFGAAVAFHIVFHYRRKEFEAMPKKGDVKESIHIIKAMVTGGEEPPSGKFLAEQRLAYIIMGLASLGLLITGMIKVLKNFSGIQFGPTLNEVNTLLHTGLGGFFLFLVFAHLAAFGIKANLPLLPTMFTGYVNREYAEKRHPLWTKTKKN